MSGELSSGARSESSRQGSPIEGSKLEDGVSKKYLDYYMKTAPKPRPKFQKRTKADPSVPSNEALFNMMIGPHFQRNLVIYKHKFIALCCEELNAEKHRVHTRLSKWPFEKLQSQGVCLTGLLGRISGRSMTGETLVKLSRRGFDEEIGKHKFMMGDVTFLSRSDPLRDPHLYIASVDSMSKTTLTLSAPHAPPSDLADGEWRLDQAANQSQFDKMCANLEAFVAPNYAGPSTLRAILTRLIPEYMPELVYEDDSDSNDENMEVEQKELKDDSKSEITLDIPLAKGAPTDQTKDSNEINENSRNGTKPTEFDNPATLPGSNTPTQADTPLEVGTIKTPTGTPTHEADGNVESTSDTPAASTVDPFTSDEEEEENKLEELQEPAPYHWFAPPPVDPAVLAQWATPFDPLSNARFISAADREKVRAAVTRAETLNDSQRESIMSTLR
eukprot:258788_1